MALYLRLSKEDDDLADESNSITNQRHQLRSYLKEIPELNRYPFREYVDDGYSGKNFDRPGVTQLLEDVRAGEVYGIAVKDLSRFGRNHIEVGNYIERSFPLLGVRFIAVNNHFDSASYWGTTPDMDVSFENLMYDYFSEENAIKIRNDLLCKRMRGKYMAVFAPYGYKKSEEDHNRLVPDEEAAAIVRLIFALYARWGVKAQVARYLNDRGIPTPWEYAIQKGIAQRRKHEKEKKFWSSSIVGRILRNPVYIGNIVFHKKEVSEVGSEKMICLPKEEWKECKNTHEAIVSKKLFERVNGRDGLQGIETDANGSAVHCERKGGKGAGKDSPVRGLVKCGGCRHNMNRRNRANVSYYCRYYYEGKDPACYTKGVREDSLVRLAEDAVICQVILAADLKELRKWHYDMEQRQKYQWQEQFRRLRNQLRQCQNENFSLYERYKAGEIGGGEFQNRRQENLKRQKICQKQLEEYGEKGTENITARFGTLSMPGSRGDFPDITREMVKKLISAIYVYKNDLIEIVFAFRDVMAELYS